MTVNNVSVENLTDGSLDNGTWEGSKILDVLLKVMNDNIKQEFDKGRIRGADYASVYLGGLQSTIAQAIQFALGADLANVQIEGEQAKNSAMLAETIAKLNKEMGYGNAKVSTGEEVWYTDTLGVEHKYDKNTIILGTPDDKGTIDKEYEKLSNDVRILANKT